MQPEQNNPRSVPWTSRDAWLGVLFLIIWIISFYATLYLLSKFTSFDIDIGLVIGLGEALLITPVWWFAIRKYNVGLGILGFRKFTGEMAGLAFGLFILLYIFNFIYNALFSFIDFGIQEDIGELLEDISSPWLFLFAGIVIAPIVEEVFFRGFLFAGLRQRYTWQKAAFISSFLFAIIHFQLLSFIPLFVMGYAFAYIYHRSNSIWLPISMHVITNGLAFAGYYLLDMLDSTY